MPTEPALVMTDCRFGMITFVAFPFFNLLHSGLGLENQKLQNPQMFKYTYVPL